MQLLLFQKAFGPIKDLGSKAASGVLSAVTGVPFLGSALEGLSGQFENRPLGAAVIDEFGNVYDEEESYLYEDEPDSVEVDENSHLYESESLGCLSGCFARSLYVVGTILFLGGCTMKEGGGGPMFLGFLLMGIGYLVHKSTSKNQ